MSIRSFAVFAIVSSASITHAFHDSLNFIITPRARSCFYEDFTAPVSAKTIDIFVQAGGKAAIELEISGPLSIEDVRQEVHRPIVLSKTIDAVRMGRAETDSFLYDFEPSTAGTYAICLDNTRAHLMPKIVQIDVYPVVHEGIVLEGFESTAGKESAGRIKQSIDRIQKTLTRIQLTQHHDRHRQALHSELNRNSHKGLVYGSIAETVVYIIISFFQVVFIQTCNWSCESPEAVGLVLRSSCEGGAVSA